MFKLDCGLRVLSMAVGFTSSCRYSKCCKALPGLELRKLASFDEATAFQLHTRRILVCKPLHKPVRPRRRLVRKQLSDGGAPLPSAWSGNRWSVVAYSSPSAPRIDQSRGNINKKKMARCCRCSNSTMAGSALANLLLKIFDAIISSVDRNYRARVHAICVNFEVIALHNGHPAPLHVYSQATIPVLKLARHATGQYCDIARFTPIMLF